MCRCSKASQAFTLIELLVVISIIAMLVAILLPALSNSKENTRRVICLSNNRQVNFAMLTMADEHKGWVNGVDAPYTTSGDVNVPIGWPGLINAYLATPPDPGYYNYNVLATYTSRGACPSVNPVGSGAGLAANCAFTGYWYGPMHSLNEVVHTSRIMLLGDNYAPWIYQWPSVLDTTNNGAWGSGVYTYARHRAEGLNFTFIDGHGAFTPAVGAYASVPPIAWWAAAPGAGKWTECYGFGMIGE